MSVRVHLQHMAKPSLAPLFHVLHNIIDACAPANFFIGDTLFPPYSKDSPKTPFFKASVVDENLTFTLKNVILGFPERNDILNYLLRHIKLSADSTVSAFWASSVQC